MREITSPDCPFCLTEDDDKAEHTLLECDYFSYERRLLEERVGKRIIDPEDVSAAVLLSEEGWLAVEDFAANVMRRKQRSLPVKNSEVCRRRAKWATRTAFSKMCHAADYLLVPRSYSRE